MSPIVSARRSMLAALMIALASVSKLAPLCALQQEAAPSSEVAFVHDSGRVANESGQAATVISFTVRIDGARWLRLGFDEIELAGDPTEGRGSILRLTAHEDGAVQELTALHCREWRNTSAYFNGDAVQVDVFAFPGTGPNRVALSKVTMGLGFASFETICGPTDDRVLSDDARSARLLPVGCSGWMIDDCKRCFLTAGHCTNVQTAQFEVPLSDPDGTINHPSPDDQYAVDPESVQASAASLGSDWRTFGCFPNPNTGMTPAEAQGAFYDLELPPSFVNGQTIRITGYGTDDTPLTHNQVQQTHSGPRAPSGGTVLEYVTDTTGGNSGSPVIWVQGGVAIGIHTNGGCGTSGGTNSGTASSSPGLQQALANPLGVCATGVQLVSTLPDLIAPGSATKLDLEIQPGAVPGSERLFASYDGGPFLELPIVPTGGGFYEATLPPPVCGAEPRFYFSVVDAVCGTTSLPAGGASAPFTALVGETTAVAIFDMESASGWTSGAPGDTADTGQWTRVNPNGTEAQPEDDHSVPGTQCWVTGQGTAGAGQGESDVDGGTTTLLSPAIDLGGLADPLVDYWRWYSNATGGGPNTDVFRIEASGDGGAHWSAVEVLGPTGPDTLPAWRLHQFRVADVLGPAASLRLRFVAADLEPGSIVEAALDDLRVLDFGCSAQLADCNGNGIVDSDDIASGRSSDLDLDGVPDECSPDCNGNGVPDERELASTSYCFCDAAAPCANQDADAGCANSSGAGVRLDPCGSSSVANDDLVLRATGVPANQNGLVFMGPQQIELPFGDGLRCVGAGGIGVFRFPVRNSGAAGVLVEGPGLVAHSHSSFPPQGAIEAGATWNFQAWYRDPAGPCAAGFNLSNGDSILFGP